jgi:NAD(P)-dependent dehydrogenase (short-subunit alcohol dehydrogenase family)
MPESEGLALAYFWPEQTTMAEKKVVLVTGGTSGIGRAIASYLTEKGHRVYATGRQCDNGSTPEGFSLLRMDVTVEDSVKNAIELIEKEAGRLDAVVNNAGLGMVGPIELVSDNEAREIFDTNVFGVLNVCRHAIPLLRKSERGHIINITSIGGRVGLPYRGIYCSSKFAIEGLTEALSLEMTKFNIKVSIIEPGDFKTNINANRKYPANERPDLYPENEDIRNQIICEVKDAPEPTRIGRTVEQIITDPNPGLRYRVATPMQKLSVEIKKILPDRWFERLMMNHYKMLRKQ